jgi:hypothetical protein
LESAIHRYLRHPTSRATAMLRNRAGIAEGLERQWLKWRLRAAAG